MKLLQLNVLEPEAVQEMSESFDNLPQTDHLDGQYRLRRYSVLKPYTGNIVVEDNRGFTQSSKYNKFQGDMNRQFEDLEDSLVNTQGFAKMLRIFLKTNKLEGGHRLEIHQLRIITGEFPYNSVEVSPEGIHQDGYNYIGMVGIKRHNANGGKILVSRGKTVAPFLEMILEDGDMIMLNDKEVWHNGSALTQSSLTGDRAYIDLFVITANAVAENKKVKDRF